MAVIEAFDDALTALQRNTVLLVVGAIYGLVVFPQQALTALGIPILPGLFGLVLLFVAPFFTAGVIGMAHEGLNGRTAFGTLTEIGKDRYLSMLGGQLILAGIGLVFGIVFVIAMIVVVGAIGAGAAGMMGPGATPGAGMVSAVGGAAVLGILVVMLVIGLPYLAIMFLLQFFSVAVVVENKSAVDSLKRSYHVVRSNLVSTFGYWVLTVVIGLVAGIPGGVISLVRSEAVASMALEAAGLQAGVLPTGQGTALGIAVVSLVITAVVFPLTQTFATAFYERITDTEVPEDSPLYEPDTATAAGADADDRSLSQ
jgi:hypothetical protein